MDVSRTSPVDALSKVMAAQPLFAIDCPDPGATFLFKLISGHPGAGDERGNPVHVCR